MEIAERTTDTGAADTIAANLKSISVAPEEMEAGSRSGLSRYVKNSAANIVRLVLTALIAILLPAYLTHHLPVKTYGAWVLILQLGAYVGYLDFGVQTAIAKYIAEFEAKGDLAGCSRCASAGFGMIVLASILGMILTGILASRVPELFHDMPTDLQSGARIAILLVGISLSITLATSVFSAIFLGLQRYEIPMATTVATRILYAGALCAAVAVHSSLPVMGAAVAIANIAGAALQVGLWHKLANHIRVSLFGIDLAVLRQMLAYCGILTIWSLCMLFITVSILPWWGIMRSPR